MPELLASGRAADIYASGPGRVLKRYRWDIDVEREAAAMRHARAHGYPAPEVFEAGGTDLVIERVDGPTMMADVARRPWRLGAHARLLADLHERLHAISAHDGPGSLLHLDLHPDNVLLSPRGPRVIDWANARGGEPALDVAVSWVILATSAVPGGALTRALGAVGRRAFLDAFLEHAGREDAEPLLPEVARTRLATNPRLHARERPALERLAAR